MKCQSVLLPITLGLPLVTGDALAQGPSVSTESEYLKTMEFPFNSAFQPMGSARSAMFSPGGRFMDRK